MVEINFGSSTSTAAVEEVVVSSLFAAAMGIIEAMERMRNRMMVAVVHDAIVNAGGEERRRIIFSLCRCVCVSLRLAWPFISTWKLLRRSPSLSCLFFLTN